MTKITILIVDDHQIFRQGLRDSLSLDDGIEVVGEAPDGETALQLAVQLKPQVVITDVNLPGLNGLQVAQRLRREAPDTYTLILTAYDDEEQLFHAVRAGAHGFFSKDISPQHILSAVRDIVAGKYVMGNKVMEEEEVTPWVIKASERYAPIFGDEVQEAFMPLSPREMEIVQYITRGLSNKLIAHKLGISHQTVKNHMTSILRKLDVEDRTQAAIYALRHGWVRLQDTQTIPGKDDIQ
ncbi:MAG: response regulator transcription factor [Thermoflexales bacterium]|nr:response regulator transcription factor [Thermoflexales bacterium]